MHAWKVLQWLTVVYVQCGVCAVWCVCTVVCVCSVVSDAMAINYTASWDYTLVFFVYKQPRALKCKPSA